MGKIGIKTLSKELKTLYSGIEVNISLNLSKAFLLDWYTRTFFENYGLFWWGIEFLMLFYDKMFGIELSEC